MTEQKTITIRAAINAPVEQVWKFYTWSEHIVQWNNASDDWHTLSAENDLRIGGKFRYRMEAKDGSAGFDFEGIYEAVKEIISYSIGDGRKVKVIFEKDGEKTNILVTFEAESQNPVEMQRNGW